MREYCVYANIVTTLDPNTLIISSFLINHQIKSIGSTLGLHTV
jgi:hypothetical protein